MPFDRVMGPNRPIKENNGGLQPIARIMNLTLWVPSENLSFGLLPKAISSVSLSIIYQEPKLVKAYKMQLYKLYTIKFSILA